MVLVSMVTSLHGYSQWVWPDVHRHIVSIGFAFFFSGLCQQEQTVQGEQTELSGSPGASDWMFKKSKTAKDSTTAYN